MRWGTPPLQGDGANRFKFRWLLALAGLAVGPVYLFDSGLPQVGDFLVLAYSTVACVRGVLDGYLRRVPPFLASWGSLILVTVVVSLFWSVLEGQSRILINPLFYLFNFMFGFAVLWDVSKYPEFKKYLLGGCVAGLAVSAVGVGINFAPVGRASGFFNNPNQLAYFSLCGLAIIATIDGGKLVLSPSRLIAYLSALVGLVAASSLSAFGGVIVMIIGLIMANLVRARYAIRSLFVALALAAGLVVADNVTDSALSRGVQARLLRVDAKVSQANEERGFDRISEYPRYVLLGAGEGITERFPLSHHGEIHSSFLNVLFCYGIAGFLLLISTMLIALRGAPLFTYGLVAGLAVYSLTHMGLRSTSFWLALCVVHFSKPATKLKH